MSEKQAESIRPSNWTSVRGTVIPVLVIGLVGAAFFILAVEKDDEQTLFYQQAEAESGPAKVESFGETRFNLVVLTERAAERLDIQTALVQDQDIDGEQRLVIPYSAVIYGLNGETWAYISPEKLTYVRDSITVDYIEGDIAVLTDGPPVGIQVVSVGVAELYGIDTGVGK
ncbi:MAG: hypothetical protein ACE5M4_07665 [Anaerolineales bacterium]